MSHIILNALIVSILIAKIVEEIQPGAAFPLQFIVVLFSSQSNDSRTITAYPHNPRSLSQSSAARNNDRSIIFLTWFLI